MHANPPACIFPVHATPTITLKQLQIIDTLVAKFRKAYDATPQHDTFKTPGQASPNPSNFGDTWKYLCSSWSRMLAPGKCMQADLHAPPPPVRLDHLFFSGRFCLQCFVPLPSAGFSCVQTPNKSLMSARSSFHRGMSTFLVTPSMCCVFICTNSRHTLKTSLCCAFY